MMYVFALKSAMFGRIVYERVRVDIYVYKLV